MTGLTRAALDVLSAATMLDPGTSWCGYRRAAWSRARIVRTANMAEIEAIYAN